MGSNPAIPTNSARLSEAMAVLVIAWVCQVSAAHAQQRPLQVEDASGIGGGTILFQIGTDFAHDVHYPLSGLIGDLWRVGLVRMEFGLGDIADLTISGGLRDHLVITSREDAPLSDLLELSDPSATGAFDDIVVATKARLIAEAAHRPAIAVKVATRLPNAKHPSGLGLDTTDFFALALASKSLASVRLLGQTGLGILGDPLRNNRHVNSLLYGGAVDGEITDPWTWVVGIDGRTGPQEPGLESRAIARAGAEWTHGGLHTEVDVTRGLTDRDGDWGVALSLGFRRHLFTPQ